MSRLLVVFATAALVACGLAPAALAGTTGNVGWVATHTQALNLSGKLVGHAPADRQLEISAVLPLRNTAQLNKMIQAGDILTPDQVNATFGPTASTVQAVEAYLQSAGFTNVSASRNRLLVTGSATVAQAEQAFGTTISDYQLSGQTVYANTTPAMVPASLGGDVVAVLGLSDVPIAPPKLTAASTPNLSGFGPQAVANAYDDASMAPATSTTTAIIASGDMTPTIDHLRYAETQWGLPQVPVQVIYDGPQAGIVNNNPLTGNLEWDLDTQISTLVPHAVQQLDIYDVATFTDPEVARGINMFVSQDQATALSASLGECDYIAFLDGAMLTTDEALA
jgi:pseudomonalisin